MIFAQRLALLALVLSPALFCQAAYAGDRTITKVVKLLQEMLDKSKADGERDTELFAKYKCYCDINAAEKTKSIADNSEAIALLSGEISQLQASNGKLSVANAELEMQLADNERARATADSLRTKAGEDFRSEETDMENAIGQMGQAIDTLAAIGADQSASSSALLTKDKFMSKTSSLVKLNSEVKGALKAAAVLLSPKERRSVAAFLQAPFTGAYTAQSGEIVGILKNMRDTFKSNLASARAAESASSEAHTKFSKVKTDEYDRGKASFNEKDTTLGANDNSLSTKKEQKADAETSKASDEEFLSKLLKLCASKTKQYEDRKMIRANEEAAIAQAQSILNGDAAFDNFGSTDATSTGSTGFVQMTMRTVRMSVVEQVENMLEKVAKKHKSLKLARVAAHLKEGNPLEKVVKEIENMIDLIAKEEVADDEQKAWCDSEREENHSQKSEKTTNINELEGQVTSITETLDSEVDGLRKQLSDEQATLSQNQKDQAEEVGDRKLSNAAYQKNIGNLVQAQTTLKKATAVLRKFYDWLHAKTGPHHYEKKAGKDSTGGNIKRIPESTTEDLEESCSADPACVGFNSDGWLKSAVVADDKLFDASGDLYVKVFDSANPVLLQRREDPAPPEAFENESGDQTEKGGDVMGMLEFILSEAAEEEKTAHENEEESQHDFEDTITDLKSQEKTSQETIASLENQVAAKVKELEQANQDLAKTKEEKVAIEQYIAKIKPGCDFITENLDTRKENRVAETSALNTAIDKLKDTPAYKSAAAAAERDALGECADHCLPDRETVQCKACLAGTSVAGYCASHTGEAGC